LTIAEARAPFAEKPRAELLGRGGERDRMPAIAERREADQAVESELPNVPDLLRRIDLALAAIHDDVAQLARIAVVALGVTLSTGSDRAS
jgi:hypothetical protein